MFPSSILSRWRRIHTETPAFVQNRCFARLGWDREVRIFCREQKDHLSGIFAAHSECGGAAPSVVTGIAARADITPAQVIFAFARAAGMLPLTGTSNAEHMKQDLASSALALSPDAVRSIESLSG